MRLTEAMLSKQAVRRGQMALAVLAIREAEAHLNAGNHDDLISEALDRAQAAISKATATRNSGDEG
jgi:hypothetical protein